MKMGLMTNLVDIFDDQSIESEVKNFLESYAPGASWKVVANSATQPWQYYHQAFFRDSDGS